MRILFLAPHPFYQERGTPIAVDLLLRALAGRGDRVDLLTYHEGDDRDYGPAVRITRIRKPPLAAGIKPGFSPKKLIADAVMWPAARRLAGRNKYDVIHAVEESVFMARAIGRRHGIPYLYDMDSSMPQQMADKSAVFRLARPLLDRAEGAAVRGAIAVVAVCRALGEVAEAHGAQKVFLLHDISLLGRAAAGGARDLRAELGVAGPLVLYLGNLERYQGIDLLLAAFERSAAEHAEARLVIAGGAPDDIARYRRQAAGLSCGARVHFVGPQPVADMAALFEAADVLVSPRIKGTNTPMKVYSYLDSGRALLATDLPTHTQALDPSVAALAPAEPAAFAEALTALLRDEPRRRALAAAAKERARERHSPEAYRRGVNEIYDWVEQALGRNDSAGEEPAHGRT
jgi:glycosyltransferase involved in cell wall biosynthesis